MSENYGWNYFENEVVIGDKQDKKRMIVLVFSNFMSIPYNRKSFDELVDWLNEQQATIEQLQHLCGKSDYENAKLRQEIKELKAQLREKEEDEQLYANEIVKLNKEAKEVLDFKSLGGDY